jgi:hypothetical protein
MRTGRTYDIALMHMGGSSSLWLVSLLLRRLLLALQELVANSTVLCLLVDNLRKPVVVARDLERVRNHILYPIVMADNLDLTNNSMLILMIRT